MVLAAVIIGKKLIKYKIKIKGLCQTVAVSKKETWHSSKDMYMHSFSHAK